MKYYEDKQFEIDVECQSVLSRRKRDGLEYLKTIKHQSIDNLNKFVLKESNNLQILSKDKDQTFFIKKFE